MEPGPYPTYDDAVRDYVANCTALMEIPQEEAGAGAWDGMRFSAELLVHRAREIAAISEAMIPLAQVHFGSEQASAREGIQYHFIVQAAVELLLGIELLQISGNVTGIHSTAAARATWGAALVEAIGAAEDILKIPVELGLPARDSFRSESTTIGEAESSLETAIEGTLSNISRRVQELGGDIACDLLSGTETVEIIREPSADGEGYAEANFTRIGEPGKLLRNVYRKITAFGNRDDEFKLKVQKWLNGLNQGRGGDFHAIIGRAVPLSEDRKSVRSGDSAAVPLNRLNRDSDEVKVLHERFSLILMRMRKLGDAIRLGNTIGMPQFRPVRIMLQLALLSALFSVGKEYADKVLRCSV